MLYGLLGSLISLVVDKPIALRVAVLVLGDLATQDVAEGGKGIVQSLVVNCGIKILDENVALSRLAKSGIALGPHDAARAAFDKRVVELLESLLAIGSGVVVHISVSKRSTGDSIAADTNGGNGTDLGEELEEHGLGDGRIELANVKGGGSLRMRSGGARSGTCGVDVITLIVASMDSGVGWWSALVASIEVGAGKIRGELVESASGDVVSHDEGLSLVYWPVNLLPR